MLVKRTMFEVSTVAGKTLVGCVYDDETLEISEMWAEHVGLRQPQVSFYNNAKAERTTAGNLSTGKSVVQVPKERRPLIVRSVSEIGEVCLLFPFSVGVVV